MAAPMGGCSSVETVRADVPEDVTVVGFVVLDAQGRAREGTPLEPWREQLLLVGADGDRMMLVGYTDQQLAAYPKAALIGERLRPALGCTNRLPAPAYVAYVGPDGLTPIDPEMAPAITTPSVEAACEPGLANRPWAVDVTCEEALCRAPAQQVTPCTIALDLAACGGGEVRVTVDARGEICAETLGRASACRPQDDAYTAATLACSAPEEGCRVHVYQDARHQPAPFSFARRQWRQGEPRVPNSLMERAWIGVNFLRSGYANAMTVLSDRVVISGPQDVNYSCTVRPSVFYLVDQETLALIDTQVVGGCAQALVAEPGGETFLAAYLDGDSWRVGRFDKTGVELASADVVDEALEGLIETSGPMVPIWRPSAILLPPGRNEVWLVMYDNRGFEPLPGTAVVRLDAATLTPLSQRVLPQWHRSYSGAAVGRDEFILLAEWSYKVGWFSPDQAFPESEVLVENDGSIKNVYYSVRALSGGRALMAALGKAPVVVITKDGGVERMSHPAGEREQAIIDFADWPGSLKMGIGVQTVANGKREVIATLLDPDEDRFLPGVWVIGEGLASAVGRDQRGRVYALFPWTAEIARIDPLPSAPR